jgi:hypothetical protein
VRRPETWTDSNVGATVSEQRSDQLAPAAGWYTDPGDGTQLRWWSGTQWTRHFAPATQPPPVQPVTAPMGSGRRWDTVWVWLLAFLPWLWTVTFFVAVNFSGPPSESALSSYLWFLVPVTLTLLFAILDTLQLRRWHGTAAHWAWAMLGGPIYIIARTVVLRRSGRYGLAPLWVALGNVLAAFLPLAPVAPLFLWSFLMWIYSFGSGS